MNRQSITTFKEGNKYYIVIENPNNNIKKNFDTVFAKTINCITGMLKPENVDDTDEAKKIDEKVDKKIDDKSNLGEIDDKSNLGDILKKKSYEEVKKENPSRAYWYIKTKEEARSYVKEKLLEDELDKRRILIAMVPKNDMKLRVMKMKEAEINEVWEKHNMYEKAVKLVGYDPKEKDDKK